MSIPFDNAVGTLEAMFPEWDKETLTTLLISNSYHVERTIEMVLSMQGDVNSSDEVSHSVESIVSKAGNLRVSEDNDRYEKSSSSNHRKLPESSINSRYRGLKCDLPDDFLRPPSYNQSKHIIADEELALMLQNELFQKEVRDVLGDEFFDSNRQNRGGATGSAVNNRNIGSGNPVRRNSKTGAEDPADLGILKGLSSMGSAAKKNLLQMAERFSASSGGNGTSTNAAGHTGTAREFRPLVDSAGNSFEDDEEEGDEVISFDKGRGSGGGHVLQEPVISQASDNPLLQYNKTYGGGPTKKDR